MTLNGVGALSFFLPVLNWTGLSARLLKSRRGFRLNMNTTLRSFCRSADRQTVAWNPASISVLLRCRNAQCQC